MLDPRADEKVGEVGACTEKPALADQVLRRRPLRVVVRSQRTWRTLKSPSKRDAPRHKRVAWKEKRFETRSGTLGAR